MSGQGSNSGAYFDEYATGYDQALAQGLAATGETRNYFARRRIEWSRQCLDRLGLRSGDAIEFGCGTGANIPFLIEVAAAKSILGIDASEKALEVARSAVRSANVRFIHPSEYKPAGQADLVFCNGVFHHIPPSQRPAALDYIYRCLKPDGVFLLWENNPWNPGTRYVMSRIPFDADAVTISAIEGRRLVKAAGFSVLRTDFLFIFPHLLRWLRPLEPALSRLPIGGQYELLCHKPR